MKKKKKGKTVIMRFAGLRRTVGTIHELLPSGGGGKDIFQFKKQQQPYKKKKKSKTNDFR